MANGEFAGGAGELASEVAAAAESAADRVAAAADRAAIPGDWAPPAAPALETKDGRSVVWLVLALIGVCLLLVWYFGHVRARPPEDR